MFMQEYLKSSDRALGGLLGFDRELRSLVFS